MKRRRREIIKTSNITQLTQSTINTIQDTDQDIDTADHMIMIIHTQTTIYNNGKSKAERNILYKSGYTQKESDQSYATIESLINTTIETYSTRCRVCLEALTQIDEKVRILSNHAIITFVTNF